MQAANTNQFASLGVTGAAAVTPLTPAYVPSDDDDKTKMIIIVVCVIGGVFLLAIGYMIVKKCSTSSKQDKNEFEDGSGNRRLDDYIAMNEV